MAPPVYPARATWPPNGLWLSKQIVTCSKSQSKSNQYLIAGWKYLIQAIPKQLFVTVINQYLKFWTGQLNMQKSNVGWTVQF